VTNHASPVQKKYLTPCSAAPSFICCSGQLPSLPIAKSGTGWGEPMTLPHPYTGRILFSAVGHRLAHFVRSILGRVYTKYMFGRLVTKSARPRFLRTGFSQARPHNIVSQMFLLFLRTGYSQARPYCFAYYVSIIIFFST
jgi:hypothetical protein